MKPRSFLLVTLSLFVLSLLSTNVKATHMMGSDISWKCIGADSFIIKLVIYRDCNGINLNSASISFHCSETGAYVASLHISIPAPVDITPICSQACTRCQSIGCSFPFGVEQYTYQKLVVLKYAYSYCELDLSYSMCCRNASITTGGANKNFYINAKLNRCLNPCDNSPEFNNPPVFMVGLGQHFIYNHAVVDDDKDSSGNPLDSLSYSWTEPLINKNTACPYNSPYSFSNPIYYYGFPNPNLPDSMGFHLNQQTGDISFRPMKIEQTIMALKISEWRKIDGEMKVIGETRRDMQIIVYTCTNTNPLIAGTYYKKVFAGDPVSFSITADDRDQNDSLTISCINPITGAIWFCESEFSYRPAASLYWQTKKSDANPIPYTFYVNVKDNNCPINGFSSKAFQILVWDSVSIGLKEQKPVLKFETNAYLSDAHIVVTSKGTSGIEKVVFLNLAGLQILEQSGGGSKAIQIERGAITSGLYFIQVISIKGEISVNKLVLN